MSGWAPLEGMCVVEACQRVVGPLAAWQLSMLGAQITKVEPPTGDVARNWGSVFDLMNASKRFVAFDLEARADRAAFEQLCKTADVVLADASWSEEFALSGSKIPSTRTRVVVIVDDRAVPGGSGTGETLAQAALAITPYIGEPACTPERFGADLASASAAATAVQAALAGLLATDRQGPLVARVAIDRAAAALKTIHWAARSDPDRWSGYHVRAIARAPDRGYRVRDGFVTLDFLPHQRDAWRALCAEIGLDQFADAVGDDWFSTIGMEDRIDWARPYYECALARFSRDEAITLIRRHGGWSVPFQEPAEALAHPQSQLYASAAMRDGQFDVRLPWRVDNAPQGTQSCAVAPAVGAHSKEVLRNLVAEEAS